MKGGAILSGLFIVPNNIFNTRNKYFLEFVVTNGASRYEFALLNVVVGGL